MAYYQVWPLPNSFITVYLLPMNYNLKPWFGAGFQPLDCFKYDLVLHVVPASSLNHGLPDHTKVNCWEQTPGPYWFLSSLAIASSFTVYCGQNKALWAEWDSVHRDFWRLHRCCIHEQGHGGVCAQVPPHKVPKCTVPAHLVPDLPHV